MSESLRATPVEPEIAHSAIGLRIERGLRRRLGSMPNIKGDRLPVKESDEPAPDIGDREEVVASPDN
jgi:hypothetical protein